MRRRFLAFNCLWLLSQTMLADQIAEHQLLAQLVHELDALQPLIDGAQDNSDQDARVHFNYDWLRTDVERIRTGIHNHLTQPRPQPRHIAPLKGDYRQ
ncbi:MAG TPA: conjugal transfer protein [Crenotrichaceae bacterium]|nr:conjugal transfer protein [Crenotrichaceae bacterium]